MHFHIPLHAEPERPLRATTDVLRRAVAAVGDKVVIEVETYTWQVLPRGADPVDGIAAELDWAQRELLDEGGVR